MCYETHTQIQAYLMFYLSGASNENVFYVILKCDEIFRNVLSKNIVISLHIRAKCI